MWVSGATLEDVQRDSAGARGACECDCETHKGGEGGAGGRVGRTRVKNLYLDRFI